MSENIKIAFIGGVFGLLGAIVGQLDKVSEVLRGIGISKATHVVQVSESIPSLRDCDDSKDLGRVVLHSANDPNSGKLKKTAIFFCPQGDRDSKEKPRWFVAQGITLEDYKRQ